MADFVFGESFGDVSRQEAQRRGQADDRYFQTLAHNRQIVEAVNRKRQQELANYFTQLQLQNQQRNAQLAARNAQAERGQDLGLALMRERGQNMRAADTVAAQREAAQLRFGATQGRQEQAAQNRSLTAAIKAFDEFGGDPESVAQAFNLDQPTLNQFKTIVTGATRLQDEANKRNESFVKEANTTLEKVERLSDSLLTAINEPGEDLVGKVTQIIKANPLPIDLSGITDNLAADPAKVRAMVASLPQQVFTSYAQALQKAGAATLDESGRRFAPVTVQRYKGFGANGRGQSAPAEAGPSMGASQPAPLTERNAPVDYQSRALELRRRILQQNPQMDPMSLVQRVKSILDFEDRNPRPIATGP